MQQGMKARSKEAESLNNFPPACPAAHYIPSPPTHRHCQLSFFSSMPSAKSSVSVHSGNQPAWGREGGW